MQPHEFLFCRCSEAEDAALLQQAREPFLLEEGT